MSVCFIKYNNKEKFLNKTIVMGTILFNLIDRGKSKKDPCFNNFALNPANGPNKSNFLLLMTRKSRCGIDMGGAPSITCVYRHLHYVF